MAADAPTTFPPLPTEDENWGGNGGGQGKDLKCRARPWSREFAILAAMPCKTTEERQLRDKKAFILHNMFVDVAVTEATAAIEHADELRSRGEVVIPDEMSQDVIYEKEVVGLKIGVTRDIGDASNKIEIRLNGSSAHEKVPEDVLAEKNLLKGITADESTTVHVSLGSILTDVSTLVTLVCLESCTHEWCAGVRSLSFST